MADYSLTNDADDIDSALQTAVSSKAAGSTDTTPGLFLKVGADEDQFSSATKSTIEAARGGMIGVAGNTNSFTGDMDGVSISEFGFAVGATNAPSSQFPYIATSSNGTRGFQIGMDGNTLSANEFYARSNPADTWGDWVKLLHTGNTGVTQYDGSVASGTNFVDLSKNGLAIISIGRTGTSGNRLEFVNDNGVVGTVSTDVSSTNYNTSSDPRLKTPLPAPTDDEINDYFTRIVDSVLVFNWKGDPNGLPVWGFDAHKAIDNGLHMGSEGDGPRDMGIGEVYQAATYDEEGNEIKPEKKVTSAGVDQAKDMAGLVLKIEQLERRINILENK